MAILKLNPSYKNYLWGGNKLKSDFNKEFDGEVLAESWELSCHVDGQSVIAEGPFAGKSLKEYVEWEGKRVLGTNCMQFQNFPILIKFIDAKDNLSIQVHPSDDYALSHEGQYGKTEMWYVVDCAEDAYLYYGFKKRSR
jgi:mannose-6-phosphate isomerase